MVTVAIFTGAETAALDLAELGLLEAVRLRLLRVVVGAGIVAVTIRCLLASGFGILGCRLMLSLEIIFLHY